MELRQPPPAQDPALEAVELQLQLEQGLLGGKILSAALMPRAFWGGAFVPATANSPPRKGVSMSPRGQTRAGHEEGTWGMLQRDAERDTGVQQHSPLTVPLPCTKDPLTRVLSPWLSPPPQNRPMLGLDPTSDPTAPACIPPVPVQE